MADTLHAKSSETEVARVRGFAAITLTAVMWLRGSRFPGMSTPRERQFWLAALAVGIPGCRRKPERKIVSRISGPEYQQPGEEAPSASSEL